MRETHIHIPNNAHSTLTDLLQVQLTHMLDLSSHAKQAHWNVRGMQFMGLHALFDEIYTQTQHHADLIAERLVALGGIAQGTSTFVGSNTRLAPYSQATTKQEQHLKAMIASVAYAGNKLREAIDQADELGDAVTADIFTQVLGPLDKSLWMLEAHLA